MVNRIDLVKGALFGVAVGDALGAPVEFINAANIYKKYGTLSDMVGGGWLNVQPGEVTDDTQMTVAVAAGILETPEAPVVSVGKHFVAWVKSGPKDIGGTCSSSINTAAELAKKDKLEAPSEEHWKKAANRTDFIFGHRTAGNGSVMRSVYPALFYRDEETAVKNAVKISEMTHADYRASRACAMYTRLIFSAINGLANDGITGTIDKFAVNEAEYKQWKCTRNQPTGFVIDSMLCSLRALGHNDNFRDAVIEAVNLGGDADTIGAITGGLAGAFYGYEAIPIAWINSLDNYVKTTLNQLAAAACFEHGLSTESFHDKI